MNSITSYLFPNGCIQKVSAKSKGNNQKTDRIANIQIYLSFLSPFLSLQAVDGRVDVRNHESLAHWAFPNDGRCRASLKDMLSDTWDFPSRKPVKEGSGYNWMSSLNWTDCRRNGIYMHLSWSEPDKPGMSNKQSKLEIASNLLPKKGLFALSVRSRRLSLKCYGVVNHWSHLKGEVKNSGSWKWLKRNNHDFWPLLHKDKIEHVKGQEAWWSTRKVHRGFDSPALQKLRSPEVKGQGRGRAESHQGGTWIWPLRECSLQETEANGGTETQGLVGLASKRSEGGTISHAILYDRVMYLQICVRTTKLWHIPCYLKLV